MREYINENLFNQDSIDKQLIIRTSSGIVIDNTMLNAEEFSLEDSICSEQELNYGSCESGCIKFRVSNIINTIIGEEVTVSLQLNGDAEHPLQIGVYTVDSDTPTANRDWRDITCYDAMKRILEADVTEWYSNLFPTNDTTHTVKEIRDSFFSYLHIQQNPYAVLINDYIRISKTLNVVASSGETTMKEAISGKDVITRICELNACFGHIDYLGRFDYVYLTENKGYLYPRNDLYPSDDLYPKDPSGFPVPSTYRDLKYEDYITEKVSRIVIRESENDIGYILNNDTTNTYTITGNFFLYGKSSQQLKEIATNIFNAISFVTYRPMEATIRGNFCFELGDLIMIHSDKDIIHSYILERKISGIQSLKDNISAKGNQYISENNNSIAASILQIKGKSNKLERSIEETKSTITDVESGLQSQITQTANLITAEVSRATAAESSLSSRITLTETSITSEVSRAKSAEGSLSSTITQTASNICLQVKDNTTSRFTVKGGAVSIESGTITLDASGTNTGTVVIKSGTLGNDGSFYVSPRENLTNTKIAGATRSNLRFTLGSNFGVDKDGKLFCSGAEISGTIKAGGGSIAGFTITETSLTTTNAKLSANFIGVTGNRGNGWETFRANFEDGGAGMYLDVGTSGGGFSVCNGGQNYGYPTGTTCILYPSGHIGTSDRNYKKDIKDLDESTFIDFIKQLKPVSFRFKDGDDKKHYGFIAQDVREVVDTFETEDVWIEQCEIRPDGSEFHSLSYESFIAPIVLTVKNLLNTTQKQQEEINKLKQHIDILELTLEEKLSTIIPKEEN